jgi:hypothetical protein
MDSKQLKTRRAEPAMNACEERGCIGAARADHGLDHAFEKVDRPLELVQEFIPHHAWQLVKNVPREEQNRNLLSR